jgi:putative zinc finger/helix-turn-helix YgiT family protein
MKCTACRHEMTITRGNHRYSESGLENVILEDVEIRECPSCGEREVAIPNIETLHKALAQSIARRPTTISGPEIKFLRKYLGQSAADFAKLMGVGVAQVYRWEKRARMSKTSENLLRYMVFNSVPMRNYGPVLKHPSERGQKKKPPMVRLHAAGENWQPELTV